MKFLLSLLVVCFMVACSTQGTEAEVTTETETVTTKEVVVEETTGTENPEGDTGATGE